MPFLKDKLLELFLQIILCITWDFLAFGHVQKQLPDTEKLQLKLWQGNDTEEMDRTLYGEFWAAKGFWQFTITTVSVQKSSPKQSAYEQREENPCPVIAIGSLYGIIAQYGRIPIKCLELPHYSCFKMLMTGVKVCLLNIFWNPVC